MRAEEIDDAAIDFIDTQLRPTGYRLVGAFEHSSDVRLSVVGFRELWSTALGHYMYIDDVSTLETARGNGFADKLMQSVIADAKRRHCEEVHLDSGVGSDRAAAHHLENRDGSDPASLPVVTAATGPNGCQRTRSRLGGSIPMVRSPRHWRASGELDALASGSRFQCLGFAPVIVRFVRERGLDRSSPS